MKAEVFSCAEPGCGFGLTPYRDVIVQHHHDTTHLYRVEAADEYGEPVWSAPQPAATVAQSVAQSAPPEPPKVGVDEVQKPMLTREQYLQGRAMLDALPAGFYVKCGGCAGWYKGGNYRLNDKGEPLCEGCK